MKVEQVYTLVNQVTQELVGETAVLNEDLSNVVDVGNAIFGSTSIDNYVKALVNHIGKVIFVNRKYSGSAPSVLMDGWEFGSVLQKIKGQLPVARENESWELEDGKSYDPNVFYKPIVSAKFYNSRITFEIDVSITEMQVKESFSSAAQLNGFLSMITNEVDKSLTLKIDGLIMRTINHMIADTIFDEFGATDTVVTGKTGTKAVNLLYLYNQEMGETLTKDKAIRTPEFIRFCALKMKLYMDRLSKASKLFNMGNQVRFTPKELLHVVMLSEFMSAADIYLQSDTYHDDYTALPNAETVTYWQGSGTDYAFNSTSRINVTTKTGSLEMDGIIGVMFDRDALGVMNKTTRVTTNYNPKAEFWNYFYKSEAQYFNDGDENFIVFYVG